MVFPVRTSFILATLAVLILEVKGTNVILTNDDGWAVALVRAQKSALEAAGFSTVLSAPAENESGTGSSDAPAKTLTSTCEFNTCPVGSPAEGFNASDPTLNYVNSFPVTAVRFGIQTLAPKFFGGPPDIVVSGPNVGNNLGSGIMGSGTVGAATEAALEGIPAIAFSSKTGEVIGSDFEVTAEVFSIAGSQVSFTTLEPGDASNTQAAAAVTLVQALIASGKPFLPPGIALNVNFPAATGSCTVPSAFKFVLTRILANSKATDVETCGTDHLTAESTLVGNTKTCQTSVSVFNATGKVDVDAATQAIVLSKLQSILTCP